MIPLNNRWYVPYIVLKGMHESYELPEWFFSTKKMVSFRFKTNKSWYWKWRNNDDNDLSKIVGIYWGSVHKNSVRIAIRRVKDGTFEFWYYIYENGHSPQSDYGREHKLKGEMFHVQKLDKEYTIVFDFSRDNWGVFLYGETSSRSIKFESAYHAGFVVGVDFPYAGGNNKAGNDWVVPIKLNKHYELQKSVLSRW